jgi:septum formation protein
MMLSEFVPNLQICAVPDHTENIPSHGNVGDIAQQLAYQKLQAVLAHPLNADIRFIITADTLVAHDNRILGKPNDIAEARRMLLGHLGQTHTVVSAAWIYDRLSHTEHPLIETAQVRFRPISPALENIIEDYLKLAAPEGPLDKAGAYGIQEPVIKTHFIEHVEGPHEAIVGFPLQSFLSLWHVMILDGGARCHT